MYVCVCMSNDMHVHRVQAYVLVNLLCMLCTSNGMCFMCDMCKVSKAYTYACMQFNFDLRILWDSVDSRRNSPPSLLLSFRSSQHIVSAVIALLSCVIV